MNKKKKNSFLHVTNSQFRFSLFFHFFSPFIFSKFFKFFSSHHFSLSLQFVKQLLFSLAYTSSFYPLHTYILVLKFNTFSTFILYIHKRFFFFFSSLLSLTVFIYLSPCAFFHLVFFFLSCLPWLTYKSAAKTRWQFLAAKLPRAYSFFVHKDNTSSSIHLSLLLSTTIRLLYLYVYLYTDNTWENAVVRKVFLLYILYKVEKMRQNENLK